MMNLTILSLLLGAILGLRFKVFILVPVIFSGLVVSTIAGFARGADLWPMVLTMMVASAALQLGYLGGTAALFFIASGQTTDRPKPSQGADCTRLSHF